jgi:hypothetical protein
VCYVFVRSTTSCACLSTPQKCSVFCVLCVLSPVKPTMALSCIQWHKWHHSILLRPPTRFSRVNGAPAANKSVACGAVQTSRASHSSLLRDSSTLLPRATHAHRRAYNHTRKPSTCFAGTVSEYSSATLCRLMILPKYRQPGNRLTECTRNLGTYSCTSTTLCTSDQESTT